MVAFLRAGPTRGAEASPSHRRVVRRLTARVASVLATLRTGAISANRARFPLEFYRQQETCRRRPRNPPEPVRILNGSTDDRPCRRTESRLPCSGGTPTQGS